MEEEEKEEEAFGGSPVVRVFVSGVWSARSRGNVHCSIGSAELSSFRSGRVHERPLQLWVLVPCACPGRVTCADGAARQPMGFPAIGRPVPACAPPGGGGEKSGSGSARVRVRVRPYPRFRVCECSVDSTELFNPVASTDPDVMSDYRPLFGPDPCNLPVSSAPNLAFIGAAAAEDSGC
ncbi:unnamed protein product [Pleuronectes platessa]|uniref:Uncharacterized protein n=1 Tax=Pleuronectes platessa TaxID=8262 RepID=A0A9N7TSL3_PLEPL|nr:unnamed protein product [Pleuronectes platessa]